MKTRHFGKIMFLSLAAALCLQVGVAYAREWDPEYEKKVGQQALEQVKKEYKIWDNPEEQQRLLQIVNDLKPHTQRPDVEYQIVLLDSDEVNAFSLPGSIVCVSKALINEVQSVDELAGVLGHEMTHNCFYDALNEASRAQKVTMPIIAAVIAAMVTGKSSETVSNVLTAGMFITHGVLSTYSINIEFRADHNGVAYLIASHKYNPVGLLSFMERLAAKERSRPPVELGVFQTHPYSAERVAAIIRQIRDAGLDINRRAVTKWDPPTLETGKRGEQEVQVLNLWGETLFTFNWAPAGTEVTERGHAMVQTLTDLLAAGVEAWEFYSEEEAGHLVIKARDHTIFHLYPADCELNGLNAEELGGQVLNNVDAALFVERLNRL